MYAYAYPITPGMGLRESIDAMLDHVARGQEYGYRADLIGASNFRSLLRDFGSILEESRARNVGRLELAPKVTDSAALTELFDTLVALCNDYAIYDDRDYSEVEEERNLEAMADAEPHNKPDDYPEPNDVLRAFWELDLYIEHESDGDVFFTTADYDAAVEYARLEKIRGTDSTITEGN